MKKIFLLLTVFGIITLSSCTGPQGPPGYPGQNGVNGTNGVNVSSEVFELKNINFGLNSNNQWTYYQTLNPVIFDSDNLLIYRLTGTIDANTPIWQLIPRTLFLSQGELDYDYDYSKQDFTLYAGGTYDISTTPTYINAQTFRIVIVPGYFSSKRQAVDLNDYNAVIKAYGLNDTNVKVLNSK